MHEGNWRLCVTKSKFCGHAMTLSLWSITNLSWYRRPEQKRHGFVKSVPVFSFDRRLSCLSLTSTVHGNFIDRLSWSSVTSEPSKICVKWRWVAFWLWHFAVYIFFIWNNAAQDGCITDMRLIRIILAGVTLGLLYLHNKKMIHRVVWATTLQLHSKKLFAKVLLFAKALLLISPKLYHILKKLELTRTLKGVTCCWAVLEDANSVSINSAQKISDSVGSFDI